MKSFTVGYIGNLRVTADAMVFACFIGIFVVISLAAAVIWWIPANEAIFGGLLCAVLHYAGETIHNLGHAWAARRTGYPMIGIRMWTVLGRSVYPRNEPELPASIHIRRALGGPAFSALTTVVAGIIALLLRPWDQTPGWIAAFFFLDNLLVFTLGAFLPLNFTDGGTLLKYWGK